jgi:predicted dehydrogenase
MTVDLRDAPADLVAEPASPASAAATSPVVADASAHRAVLEDFLVAIARGTAPCCDGEQGRRSVELVEAIYRASRTNEPVELQVP